jgi:endonuclease I
MAGHSGRLLARTSPDAWEPPDCSKGAVARALMYMACAYADRVRLVEGASEEPGALGSLSDVLEWNRRHPPTDRERRRNDAVERYQGNRNPFIDLPSLADTIDWAKR